MNLTFSYGKGFEVAPSLNMRDKVKILQEEVSKLPQYEPETKHYFHAGMYCREVFRHAGVLVVGKVHKKEHFYLIVSGTVQITDGEGNAQEVTGPHLFLSKPGTKRAVYAVTDTLAMTFHVTDATTVEDAEQQLVEEDPNAMYALGNKVRNEQIEVSP
jgi:hypothetical protein